MAKGRSKKRLLEDPDDGKLSSSRVRSRWLSAWGFVIFLGAVPLTFITWLLYAMARRDLVPWPVVAVLAAVSGVLWLIGVPLWQVVKRGSAKHDRTANAVDEVAQSRGWKVDNRVREWESGWSLAPFSKIKNVVVSPGATGKKDGVTYGVAYLEGDIAIAGSEVKSFQTRLALADVGTRLPATVFVAERFVDALAELVGGTDLDVESAEFNRSWRVKTLDAAGSHGILTPRVIEYLIKERAPGLAIQFDGTWIVIWDDAKSDKIDLDERLELLEGLVERLPGFLKSPR